MSSSVDRSASSVGWSALGTLVARVTAQPLAGRNDGGAPRADPRDRLAPKVSYTRPYHDSTQKNRFLPNFWENRSSGPQSDSAEGFVCRAAGRRTMNLRTCRIFRVSSPDDEHLSVTALGLSHHLSRTAAAITAGLEVETAAATAILAPIPARRASARTKWVILVRRPALPTLPARRKKGCSAAWPGLPPHSTSMCRKEG